jgi:hypothetical protein
MMYASKWIKFFGSVVNWRPAIMRSISPPV